MSQREAIPHIMLRYPDTDSPERRNIGVSHLQTFPVGFPDIVS